MVRMVRMTADQRMRLLQKTYLIKSERSFESKVYDTSLLKRRKRNIVVLLKIQRNILPKHHVN